MSELDKLTFKWKKEHSRYDIEGNEIKIRRLIGDDLERLRGSQ